MFYFKTVYKKTNSSPIGFQLTYYGFLSCIKTKLVVSVEIFKPLNFRDFLNNSFLQHICFCQRYCVIKSDRDTRFIPTLLAVQLFTQRMLFVVQLIKILASYLRIGKSNLNFCCIIIERKYCHLY